MTESMSTTEILRLCAERECGECCRIYNEFKQEDGCRRDLCSIAADTIDRLTTENEELNAWKSGKKGVEDYLKVAYNLNQRNGELITANRKTAELMQKTQQLERENARLKIEIGNAGTICHGCPVARERTMLRSENARLTAELAEYRSLAAEYGIDGKTILALAKSQIATARENARLTERLGMAVDDMKFVFEQKRAFADSEVLDGIDCICPLCACWLGYGAKSCDGDCNNAQWRGEESE